MKLGHEVRLMPPRHVKAYVKRNKNDAADAEAICEAVTRPTMRFVPVKTVDQQSVLMLHRTRQLFIRQRTTLINSIRAHLAEFGIKRPDTWQLRPAVHQVNKALALANTEPSTHGVRQDFHAKAHPPTATSSWQPAVISPTGATNRPAGVLKSMPRTNPSHLAMPARFSRM